MSGLEQWADKMAEWLESIHKANPSFEPKEPWFYLSGTQYNALIAAIKRRSESKEPQS